MVLPLAFNHVLVVDDYEGSADILAELLEAISPTPITTATGHNGAEAVALVAAERPVLVLLDINMPVMDGEAAARAIRSLPGRLPVLVAMTGNLPLLEALRRNPDFDHVLAKPVDVVQILALLA